MLVGRMLAKIGGVVFKEHKAAECGVSLQHKMKEAAN
jgi:hypothetical protein